MKRSIILAAALALVLSAVAFAYDFGSFTMDIPPGWTASTNGPTAIAMKNDKSASISVTMIPDQGLSAKEFADAFAEEFKKSFAIVTTPKAESDGSYSWEMATAEGTGAKAALFVNDGKCNLFVMTGTEDAMNEILPMLGTIKEK